MLPGGGDDVILGCGGEIGGNAEVVFWTLTYMGKPNMTRGQRCRRSLRTAAGEGWRGVLGGWVKIQWLMLPHIVALIG